MAGKLPKWQNVTIQPDDPVYVISVVSELVGIPVWTLRKLDDMGIVSPQRLGKKTRCYSTTQIKKLCYVQYLMNEKGVNISGIKMIIEISGDEHGF
jgi:MerR family transcriptional regulator/heat shock protein HspR